MLTYLRVGFSALQRAEIAEILHPNSSCAPRAPVSVLFNEPKLLKSTIQRRAGIDGIACFSALQRAEIAEICGLVHAPARGRRRFSALQRAEIAEIGTVSTRKSARSIGFSALQRAEIAEIFLFLS